jgi:hypothetical protein
MGTPRKLRRIVLPVGTAALVACIVAALLPGAVASADTTGGIAQSPPVSGAVLQGSAYSGQLAVTGSSGTVTFAQSSGGDVSVSSTGVVSAPASLASGAYTASGTDSDTSGNTGTWTFTLNVLTPAPAGFVDTVNNVYQSEYNVAAQLGQTSSVPSLSQYQSQVGQLNEEQLSALYAAAQQNPEWYQIPSLMQTVSSDVGGAGGGGAAAIKQATSRFMSSAIVKRAATTRAAATHRATAHRSSTHRSTSRSWIRSAQTRRITSLQRASASTSIRMDSNSAVTTFTPADCGPQIPDAAVFALQIVVDVAQTVLNLAQSLALTFADGFDAQFPYGIAAIVATAVLGVAQIIHDVLAFLQQLSSDCDGNNVDGYLANIDNTTVQTYSLLASMSDAITQIQMTENTTQQEISDVENQLTVLQTTFVNTMATDTQTLQTTIGSDTQNVTTQLQTNISGVNQDLQTIINDENNLNQVVTNNTNNSTTNIQNSISSSLTKVLSEIDTQAQSINNLVNIDTQQILNTVQSDFTTQQGQHNADLTLQIERALATWGSNVPQVTFMLPSSQGGFLNTKPVGVESVVTNDINLMKADGAKLTSATVSNYNQAEAALAKGQWLTAYQDFALCYQGFA